MAGSTTRKLIDDSSLLRRKQTVLYGITLLVLPTKMDSKSAFQRTEKDSVFPTYRKTEPEEIPNEGVIPYNTLPSLLACKSLENRFVNSLELFFVQIIDLKQHFFPASFHYYRISTAATELR